jgi:Rrf2 family protein
MMMVLSQAGKYALRAAIYLTRREGSEPVTVGEIAEALDVPKNYLSKILHQLAREGVLTSSRGPHGGFRLAIEPDQLSLAQILEPVDPFGDRRCLLGRAQCSDADPCPLHSRWQGLADGIERLLQTTFLGELSRPDEEGGRP